MATSEEDVQAKREKAQSLREAIQAEKDKRDAAAHQQELDAMAALLDDEILNLQKQLDYEAEATRTQLGEPPVEAPAQPVEPPQPPSTAKASAAGDTVKEK